MLNDIIAFSYQENLTEGIDFNSVAEFICSWVCLGFLPLFKAIEKN